MRAITLIMAGYATTSVATGLEPSSSRPTVSCLAWPMTPLWSQPQSKRCSASKRLAAT